MRKVLILILTLFVCIWIYIFAFKGVNTFFTVYNIDEISAKQKEVNDKITEVKNLQKEDLAQKEKNLETSVKDFKKIKSEYDDLMLLVSQKGEEGVGDFYDIEYLWTRLGIYSTKHGVDIALTINKSPFNANNKDPNFTLCDFDFTISGTYINLTNYIYSMEDDSNLYFSIRNFKMISADSNKGDKNTATFSVTKIPITASGIQEISNKFEENNTSVKNNVNGGASNGGTQSGGTSSSGTTNSGTTNSGTSNSSTTNNETTNSSSSNKSTSNGSTSNSSSTNKSSN